MRAADVAKSDIDVAAEAHARESLASARLVMEKLYRRNPREWHKGGVASADAVIFFLTFPFAKKGAESATISARSITHLMFVLVGNDPCAELAAAPKAKRSGVKRQSAAILIGDHAEFVKAVYKTHGA